ncbi:MAG: thioredoxin domain-containing protein [Bacteroidetes bacterium]|nr:thioredoxin domain-containing protein [Bacteroidota bacterium]
MPNRLIHESSPYLLQHANNPVDWYAWGDEPFEVAKRENKPVLVSIGYSACHWCHVMEHESFEDEETAAYMNTHFINIKVDREEHPGVDHYFMDAIQAISGSGGWPLNAFTTPERVPFYGGTYFPPKPMYNRASWRQVLESMNDIWQHKPDEIDAQSKQMLQYLKQVSRPAISSTGKAWKDGITGEIATNILKQADTVNGGFGRAPKFPGTMVISYLLEHYRYTHNEAALQQALLSLDRMIEGGIYDQLAGGFARYATDDKWLVPHFEKMLYDNALLVSVLSDAYALTKKNNYKTIIEKTITFINQELINKEKLYYSALDADSEGEEGKYYTWTWAEWNELIGDEIVAKYWGVTQSGNWEHTNILHVAANKAQLASEAGITEDELDKRIAAAIQKLLKVRESRVRPGTDDKCLLSWNALMSIALSKAGKALENKDYIRIAEEHMNQMVKYYREGSDWKHSYKAGKATIPANLDDLAYLAQACIQLSSAGGNEQWLTMADGIMEQIAVYFLAEDGDFCYYTSADNHDVPVRKTEVYDGATPSANAVLAHNLLVLGLCFEKTAYVEQAYSMLQKMAENVSRYPTSFGYWVMLVQRWESGFKTVVCTGQKATENARDLNKYFLPEVVIVTSQKEISEIPLLKGKFSTGEEMIYVCDKESCMPPMPLPADVLAYLHK